MPTSLPPLIRRCWARGWMPATSGNASIRTASGCLVSASGVDKSAFESTDLLPVDVHGLPLAPGRVPSAETGLHAARYAADPSVGAILHVHSPNAVLVSRRFGSAVVLEGFELLKAFRGVSTHDTRVAVPIVENDQDIGALAVRAEAAVAASRPCFGYLVRSHGLYAWGSDPREAERHAEAFDALFGYVLAEAS